uniref:Uncharacterized protein n=1 Tax=Oryza barthii TaxID=65489 RepID=A0A0D3GL73_9ORYZ
MAARASPSRGWVAEKDVLDLNIISRNAVPLPEQDRLVPLAAIVESPSNSSTSDLSVGKVLQVYLRTQRAWKMGWWGAEGAMVEAAEEEEEGKDGKVESAREMAGVEATKDLST